MRFINLFQWYYYYYINNNKSIVYSYPFGKGLCLLHSSWPDNYIALSFYWHHPFHTCSCCKNILFFYLWWNGHCFLRILLFHSFLVWLFFTLWIIVFIYIYIEVIYKQRSVRSLYTDRVHDICIYHVYVYTSYIYVIHILFRIFSSIYFKLLANR